MKKRMISMIMALTLSWGITIYAAQTDSADSLSGNNILTDNQGETTVFETGGETTKEENQQENRDGQNEGNERFEENEEYVTDKEKVSDDNVAAIDTVSRNVVEMAQEETYESETIYHVSLPADVKAYLDPENLSGKGQIFSDHYEIENYGNTDIILKITNIKVDYLSASERYELSDDEVTDQPSGIKKLNIKMVWENQERQEEKILLISEGKRDEYVLRLNAAEYDKNGALLGGSTGFFYFIGTLNSNPNLVWEDGEVTIRFDYEIINAEG